MVDAYGLSEVWVPENRHVSAQFHDKPKANIFMSPEFLDENRAEENRGKRALVLIQGTGAVRAGIWARSVCINESLELGSMLPFIDLCRNLSIPVLVMNPNMSTDPETNQEIPFSQTMDVHAVYVEQIRNELRLRPYQRGRTLCGRRLSDLDLEAVC